MYKYTKKCIKKRENSLLFLPIFSNCQNEMGNGIMIRELITVYVKIGCKFHANKL